MEKIKISNLKPVFSYKSIDIMSIAVNDNGLEIILDLNEHKDLHIGDTLRFSRPLNRGDYSLSLNVSVEITNIIRDENKIYVNPLENAKIIPNNSKTEYVYNENILEMVKFTCNAPHNLFLQDIMARKSNPFHITAYDFDGNPIQTQSFGSNSLRIVKGGAYDIATSGDTFFTEVISDCNGTFYERKYVYLPENFDIYSFIATGISESENEIAYFTVDCNPFYWVDESFNVHLWEDPLQNDSVSVFLQKKTGYWEDKIMLFNSFDDTALVEEEQKYNNIAESLTEANIPETIDMERIRVSPYIRGNMSNWYKPIPVNEIEINTHFRVRKNYGFSADGNINFAEGWYIDDELGWNNDEYPNMKSDSLGYLGFLDNDVNFRKSKIKKSFIRLSFYDSPDPMTQSLLFYSTVFMDSSEKFSQFMKLKNEIRSGLVKWDKSLVTCNSGTTINSKFIITNELDRTKSAEGYNIYLFGDDFSEKKTATIYLKVEFNHAGYGKTIPLVLFQSEDDKNGISVKEYFERLYIPLKVEIGEKKCYFFPEIPYGIEKNAQKITITLYEPKIIKEDEN